MTTLYKYQCSKCEVDTYVEWCAHSKETLPCCADCGKEEHMKLIGEADICIEEEYE